MAKNANSLAKNAVNPPAPLKLAIEFCVQMKDGTSPHQTPWHKHSSWQLDLMLDDACLFFAPHGATIEISTWDSILIPPETMHSFLYKRKEAAWIALWFSGEGLPALDSPIRLKGNSVSKAIALAMSALLDDGEKFDDDVRYEAAGDCLSVLLRATMAKRMHEPKKLSGVAGNALRWIERSQGKRVDVKELCEGIGCSASHLSHSFRKEFGRSLKEFIDERRAEFLARALTHVEIAPAKIARDFGFRDVSELSRFCRRNIGSSPRNFREAQAAAAKINNCKCSCQA